MQQDDSPVTGYMFYSPRIDTFLRDVSTSVDDSLMGDYSEQTMMTINLSNVAQSYRQNTYDKFYVPTEVNGELG